MPGVRASTGASAPLPLVVLAVLGAAALLIAAALAATRARGCDPAPAAAWRHAWQEAGYRAGGTWADFEDWFRSV